MTELKSINRLVTFSVLLLLLVSLAVTAAGVYVFLRHEAVYPGTSDAYVTAHVVRIEPQIGGRIIQLPVKDHQAVDQGQLLLEIDARPYRIALQRAQAELTLAQQQALAADAGVQAAAAAISQRQASMIGFIDAYWFVTLSFLLLAPLLLLLRRKPNAPLPRPAGN